MKKTYGQAPYLKTVCILAAAAVIFALVSFGTAFAGRASRPDIVYTNESFRTAQNADGELYIFDSWRLDENYGGTDRRIVSPVFSLRNGIYRITAAYTSGMPAEMLMEHGAHLSLVPEEEIPNQPDPALYSESAMLTAKTSVHKEASAESISPDTVSVLAYVSYKGTNVKIKVSADDGIPADVTLYNASVRYLPFRTAAGRFITWLPAVWLVTLLILYFLKKKKTAAQADIPAGDAASVHTGAGRLRENLPVILCLAVLVYLASLPVLTGRVPDGSDLRFHYYRIYSIAEGLAAGVFPVRIQSGWMNGFGYANGIFYPDAMLYLPAALYCLGIRMDRAYRVMAVLIQCLTVLISYLSFYRVARNRHGFQGQLRTARFAALTGSALYTMALPLLYNLYSMAGVGAASASAFAPLVIAGMHDIYRTAETEAAAGDTASAKASRGGGLKGPVLLALGMAGMLSNHLMSFLFAFLFLLVYALMHSRRTFTKKTLAGIAAAAAAAMAATAFVWIPFITERLAMSDMRGSERHWRLMDNAATPAELFATAYSVNTTDFQINATGILHAPTRGLGIMSLLILLITVCILCVMCRRADEEAAEDRKRLLRCFILTLCIILVSGTWMPYDAVKAYLPGIYGVIEKIQFPLRVHPAASLLIAYMAVQDILLAPEAILSVSQPDSKALPAKTVAVMSAAFIAVLAVLQGVGYLSQYNNEVAPFRYAARMQDLKNYVSGGEYLPASFDTTGTLVPDEGLYDPSVVRARIVSRGYNRITMQAENRSDAPAAVVFPLTYYPGYRVRLTAEDGTVMMKGKAQMDGSTQRAAVLLPAGFAGTAAMQFREPWYWRAAEVVSLAAAAGMIAVLIRKKKES